MKTIIIYATKYGATKQIAGLIANELGNATLCDIKKEPTVSLDDYDTIVLGSPLTAGMIRKEIKEFTKKNSDILKEKQLGLFVSGLQADGEEEYFKQNFSEEFLNSAKTTAFLGGVFDPDKCGFMARKVINAVAKLDSYTSTIDEDRIREFANHLK